MSARRNRTPQSRREAATPVAPPTSSAQTPTDAGNGLPADATQLLTAAQVAERWQVRPKQVYALVNRGEVPCIRIGRYRRFRLQAIEAWERAQEGAIK